MGAGIAQSGQGAYHNRNKFAGQIEHKADITLTGRTGLYLYKVTNGSREHAGKLAVQ
jgi:hypothetical protein